MAWGLIVPAHYPLAGGGCGHERRNALIAGLTTRQGVLGKTTDGILNPTLGRQPANLAVPMTRGKQGRYRPPPYSINVLIHI